MDTGGGHRRWFSVRGAAALLLLVSGVPTASFAAGTSLSIVFDEATIACRTDGTGADVNFGWTVTSTGSADSAVVTGQVNGGDVFALPGIASGNAASGGGWTFAGRMKTADGSYSTTLANGTYTLEVCATQSGANGTAAKTSCATQTVTVNCTSPDPCANAQVFGEIPANKNLCKANGHIQTQFSGSFGETATLLIEGPADTGFTRETQVNRAGDSCNYHDNWDPQDGNGGPGTYTFRVNPVPNSTDEAYEFSATLSCETNGGGGGRP